MESVHAGAGGSDSIQDDANSSKAHVNLATWRDVSFVSPRREKTRASKRYSDTISFPRRQIRSDRERSAHGSAGQPGLWNRCGSVGRRRHARRPAERARYQAARLCSIVFSVPVLIAMRRGFMASGTSRTRSMFKRPWSNDADFTCT